MEYYELVKARHSVRKFTAGPVSQEALDRALDAARLAPSWRNGQCWRFIVIDDRETKKALADLIGSNPGAPAVRAAPYTIVLCALPDESGELDDKPYYLVDSGIAAAHLLLALTNEGLGGCFVGLFDEAQARALLGVPRDVKIVGFTPVGVPAGQPRERNRKALPELLHRNRW